MTTLTTGALTVRPRSPASSMFLDRAYRQWCRHGALRVDDRSITVTDQLGRTHVFAVGDAAAGRESGVDSPDGVVTLLDVTAPRESDPERPLVFWNFDGWVSEPRFLLLLDANGALVAELPSYGWRSDELTRWAEVAGVHYVGARCADLASARREVTAHAPARASTLSVAGPRGWLSKARMATSSPTGWPLLCVLFGQALSLSAASPTEAAVTVAAGLGAGALTWLAGQWAAPYLWRR